jgi:hypothetical protein
LSIGGPKESGNRDKSLHGLMVALAIAGSVILFAYTASDSVPDGTTDTADELASLPERQVVAEKVEEPQAEKIESADSIALTERLTYVNATTETREKVSTHTEVEIKESMNVSESEVESSYSTSEQSDKQEEKK